MEELSSLEVRRPTIEDSAAAERIVNDCTLTDVGLAVYKPGELRARWTESPGDLDDLRVVVDKSGRVLGFLEMEPDPAKHELYFEGYVAEEATGGGVGSLLIEAAEERASAMAADAGHPIEVTTNLGKHGLALIESRGYERVFQEFAMFLDLEQDRPALPWPEGVHPRPFVEGADESDFATAMRGFFGEDWPDGLESEEWIRSHKSDPNYDPALWWFATRGEEVVGVVQGRKQWRAQTDTGWLKNIAVREGARKLGVGRALLLHLAGIFQERGKARMVLGTDSANLTGAPDFYLRIGMRIGGESFDYRKLVGPPRPDG